MRSKPRVSTLLEGPAKAPTGIHGLDEITGGGLPRGRPTLLCGGPGCGKTLLAVEFLIHGALKYGEPGVFMSFEETADALAENTASLGFDLHDLVRGGLVALDHVRVERSEIEETGEYDLEGLFVRLGYAIDSIGAKRVVLDTVESLFGGLSNEAIVRAELRRLFNWLRERRMTAIITGERGQAELTRHGLEEYVSDCVIFLDHRVEDQVSTRRIRIVKYRGSAHGSNEYPFVIDRDGIHVVPVTSLGLDHAAPTQRVSTGSADLDSMLGGRGYYRGTSVLVTGTAGSGKTTLAAQFTDAACARGEQCLYFSFEESPAQIIRNMKSVGIDLARWVERGRLLFHAVRPTFFGLEMHLAVIDRLIEEHHPQNVVVDSITAFAGSSQRSDVRAMFLRLIDQLKSRKVTGVFTSLVHDGGAAGWPESGVSSLIDTWIELGWKESDDGRRRTLFVVKGRGIAHSNEVRRFTIGSGGIRLHAGSAGAPAGRSAKGAMADGGGRRRATARHTSEVRRGDGRGR